MYRGAFQKGFFTVFSSLGRCPLDIWDSQTKNGFIKRIMDEDIKSLVFEILGANVSTTFIKVPKDPKESLGIKLPFMVMLIKNMYKYFCFEVKVIDDQRFNRRFRVANFNSKTSVKPFSTTMPMGMSPGWNQIQFNMADFTRRAYGTNFMEVVSIEVHANIRIKHIYFTDRLYQEDELPDQYRLVKKVAPKRTFKDYRVPAARPPTPAKSTARSKKSSESPSPAPDTYDEFSGAASDALTDVPAEAPGDAPTDVPADEPNEAPIGAPTEITNEEIAPNMEEGGVDKY